MVKWQLDVPVVGILRGIESQFFAAVMKTSFNAGLKAIEVTLNTKNALDMIQDNRPRVPKGHFMGAGTVCCLKEAKEAIDSGAMFLVTPNFNIDVIQYAVSCKIPVVAGALTPTEIYNAWKAGASMVKVFPCQVMGGPQYIKEVCGPFDSIPLCAVGGVTKENIQDYFKAGAQAVGVSSALFGKDALATKDIEKLTENVKQFIQCSRI
ncbi:MAG: bifunctional 4-hydroxy-2-oxoglutarate aldolase/2-dehydro-3-deoxy-phosphogluconate aldolase [Pseudomonadota bacterium]